MHYTQPQYHVTLPVATPAVQDVTTGPSMLLTVLMEELYQQGLTLDYHNLPVYSNLTVAGMYLTGKDLLQEK